MQERKSVKDLILAAVTDCDFREKFLVDPEGCAKEMGLSESDVKRVARMDVRSIAERLASIESLSNFGNPLVAAHSRDHSSGGYHENDHDKDGNDHGKDLDIGDWLDLVGQPEQLSLLVENVDAFRQGLKDEAVVKAILRNPELMKIVLQNDKLLSIFKERVR